MKTFIIKFLLARLNKDERHQILTEAVKNLYNTIAEDDILNQAINGEWSYMNKTISPTEQKLLIAEARVFTETKLWKVLRTDIRYQANKKMFTHSKQIEDLIAGKFILWTLDIIKTRLASLVEKQSGKFNTKNTGS